MKKKKYRLKKSVRRVLYILIGTVLGCTIALNTNAIAAETTVTVDSSKISIDDYEYFKNKDVIKVILPSSLQQIGFSSFEGCSNLSDINLPEGLSVIDNRAFAKCTSIKSITIPNSVVFIGNAAFYDCDSLDNVTLPDRLDSISNNMFYDCGALSTVNIPNSVKTIGQQSFYNCTNLFSVTLPEQVTTISEGAFYSCINLANIYIPASVSSIGLDAFKGCNNITIVAPADSYAIQYAIDNNIKYKLDSEDDVEEMAYESTVITTQTPDVPATGVDTYYLYAIMLVICSVLGLVIINKNYILTLCGINDKIIL